MTKKPTKTYNRFWTKQTKFILNPKIILSENYSLCPLKGQLSVVCRRNTYLWRHPTNNSAMVSNRSSELTKRYQFCNFQIWGASAVWHVESSCWNQIFPIFFSSIFVNKNSFNMTIGCTGPSLLIFEGKWPNYTSGPKSALCASVVQCMCAGFLCPKCDNFACLHTR